ncbi:MAG: alpha/beta hydrolase [Gammaproteobacteria bacterium]|nr:MAG: alpha/beta hydrolase [Gammaproteobacteria bacterium]
MQNTQNLIKNYNIKLSHIEVAASNWGDANGKPIIALHGWLDNMASFYPLLKDTRWLKDNNLLLITVDWPGHGHSDHRLEGQQYHLLEYVQDLHDIIDYLTLDKVSFLAHSMGAAIASLYAGSFPEVIDKLILLEGLSPLTQPASEGPEQLAKAIRSRSRSLRKSHFKDISPVLKARKQGSDLSDDSVRLLIERNMEKTAQGHSWRSDPRVRLPSYLRLTPEQSQAFINNLSMPVLLLYGKEGFIQKYPDFNKRISMSQHINTKQLDGGHHLHMQYPQQVIDAVVEFMK